jgi:hypothetical protein
VPAVGGAAERGNPSGRLLQLADGQRLRGQFAGGDGGALQWSTKRFGELSIELDDLHRAVLVPEDQSPDLAALAEAASSGDDAILLANGDTLTGFIEAAGAEGLEVEIEGQRLTLGWDRIAALQLPNPVRRDPAVWLRLRDGSRLRVEKAALDGETFTGEAFGGKPIEVPTDAVAAVDFFKRHRLMPLGRLEATTVSGGHVFGVPMPPEVEGERARLHAPLALRFGLPEGARRFAADAALEEGDGSRWADLQLSVRHGQGERFSERLKANRPEARVNVGLRDRTLTIRLGEGANGPIRDRLRLRNAVLLVETAPGG